jgi:hypothetical protein
MMRNILALMFASAFTIPAAGEGVLTHYPSIESHHVTKGEVIRREASSSKAWSKRR